MSKIDTAVAAEYLKSEVTVNGLITDFTATKGEVEKLIKAYVDITAKKFGVPTKDEFLSIIAKLLAEVMKEDKIPLPIWLVWVKPFLSTYETAIILGILKLLDKYALTKWFGADWYTKFQKDLGML